MRSVSIPRFHICSILCCPTQFNNLRSMLVRFQWVVGDGWYGGGRVERSENRGKKGGIKWIKGSRSQYKGWVMLFNLHTRLFDFCVSQVDLKYPILPTK